MNITVRKVVSLVLTLATILSLCVVTYAKPTSSKTYYLFSGAQAASHSRIVNYDGSIEYFFKYDELENLQDDIFYTIFPIDLIHMLFS